MLVQHSAIDVCLAPSRPTRRHSRPTCARRRLANLNSTDPSLETFITRALPHSINYPMRAGPPRREIRCATASSTQARFAPRSEIYHQPRLSCLRRCPARRVPVGAGAAAQLWTVC